MNQTIRAAKAVHAALLALPLTLCMVSAAQAQNSNSTGMQRVEVSGRYAQMPRTDVTKVCPNIARSLQRSLAREVNLSGQTGIVDVKFTLRGDTVTSVRASNGPNEYHFPVKRAVRYLNCNGDASSEQAYHFKIAFAHDDDASQNGGSAMALLLPGN